MRRYALQAIHMTNTEFSIKYYDRVTKTLHHVEGYTSLIPSNVFDVLNPAWDQVIPLLLDVNSYQIVHTLGEPYPEAILKDES